MRFSEVVKAAGKPEPYTLWENPEDSSAFRNALRDHRVMTVHRDAGSQTDHGEVGYLKEKGSQLLVFPRSLKQFEGRRVVGINYELLEGVSGKKEPQSNSPISVPAEAPRTKENGHSARPARRANARKMIQFPRATSQPEAASEPQPADPEKREPGADEALKAIKKGVRQALEALSKDRSVTAYKILEKLVKEG